MRVASRRFWLIAVLLLATTYSLRADEYHLTLLAHPAAPFPFLSKFGDVTLDVYPRGVRADSLWLNAFSVSGSPDVVVENPFSRMYTEVPVASIAASMNKLSTLGVESTAPATLQKPVRGNAKGIAATRYRLQYGDQAWIDVWTTEAIPENPQLRAVVDQLVTGIAPPSAALLRKIPGTPVYVELNFRRFKKVALLEVKSLVHDSAGQEDALKPGALYFRAPFEAIWK